MSVKVIVRVVPIPSMPEFRLGSDWLEAIELTVHLLKPASLAAFVLAIWRFASDLGWTSDFLVSEGIFSHWQIWAALGVAMLSVHAQLTRRFLRS